MRQEKPLSFILYPYRKPTQVDKEVCSKVVATTLTKGKTVSGRQSSFCGEFWMKENEKQGGRIYGEGKREIFFFPKVRRR